jgi:hypothetical protein
MYRRLFNKFLANGDTLQVYKDNELIFASNKDGLLSLLEYIERFVPYHQEVVVFDRIIGRAAALLCVKVNCQEVYSPLGSQLAIEVLREYGIKYHLTEVVPCIQKLNQSDMCPMEKLSMDKEPEEFYKAVKTLTSQPKITT